jgi:hypothetical protein
VLKISTQLRDSNIGLMSYIAHAAVSRAGQPESKHRKREKPAPAPQSASGPRTRQTLEILPYRQSYG